MNREYSKKRRMLATGRFFLLIGALTMLLAWSSETLEVSAAPRKVKKISWSNVKKEIYLPVKKSKTLKVKIKPTKAKKRKLRWSSSNRKIATVSKKGKVKTKKVGTVTITCKVSSQPKKKVKCKIHVVKPTKKLSMSKSSVIIKIGQKYKRTASVSPKNATQKKVNYTSSNPKIASVDKNGNVTGKSAGTVTIKAAPKDGFAKAVSYQVEVMGNLKGAAKYIAHRGLSSQAPENTLKAFQLAGQNGFWGAECDIRKTSDGEFILMHDDTLSRMCGENKRPEEMSLEEIRETPIVSGNGYAAYKNDPSATTIPTLEEYLNVCKQYGIVPVIEIKMSYDWSAEIANMKNISEDAIIEVPDAENSERIEEETEEEIPEGSEEETAEKEEIPEGSEEETAEKEEIPEESEEEIAEEEEITEEPDDEKAETDIPAEILNGSIPIETMDASGTELGSAAEDDLEKLYETTKEIMGDSQYVIIDFDLQTLLKLRQIIGDEADNIILQHVVNTPDVDNINTYREYRIDLDAKYSKADASVISRFMKAGIGVNLWTIDDPVKAWNFVKMKVPYISTNKILW